MRCRPQISNNMLNKPGIVRVCVMTGLRGGGAEVKLHSCLTSEINRPNLYFYIVAALPQSKEHPKTAECLSG
jgi:hypothetical protein